MFTKIKTFFKKRAKAALYHHITEREYHLRFQEIKRIKDPSEALAAIHALKIWRIKERESDKELLDYEFN